MHIKAWVDYYDLIHSPTQSSSSVTLAKNTLLKLVTKYHDASKGVSIKQKHGFVENNSFTKLVSLRTTYIASHS